MRVVLDGSSFEIEGGVTRVPLVEWPANTRLDGQQKRKDRQNISAYSFDSWSGGLGIQNQNIENAVHLNRLWDAENVDTRYPNQITLSPNFNVCTINPSRGDLDLVLQHLDQLYLVESTRTVPCVSSGTYTNGPGIAYRFTAPNTFGSFNAIGLVTSQVSPTPASITTFGSISAIYSVGAQIGAKMKYVNGVDIYNILASFPTLGGSITGPITGGGQGTAFLIGSTNYNRIGRMTDLNGTLHIIEHTTTNLVEFWIANQSFAANSNSLSASKATVIGSYLAPLVSDGVQVYAALPEGIYN